ncbi:MAG: pyruvate kinase alpha/beta domain-containing protein [Candidatus Aerophobetes bacterium]|nr:pyruvate kinase alpha/beta domain-containing protein [Candidatus Aerophobetes bacterium]
MDELFESVKKRAKELGVRGIVVASSSGESAKRAVRELGTKDYEIIVVTDRAEVSWNVALMSKKAREEYEIKAGAKEHPSGISHDSPVRKELKDMGINWIIQAPEIFRGINVPGGCNVAQVIAQTLYLFGSGTKVAIKITLIACDTGVVRAGEEVIAVAGSNKGLNTALLLIAAHTDEFFGIGLPEAKKPIQKLRVKEVIYKRD